MLRCQLYGDSSDIIKHFGNLRVRTEMYLLKKGTSVQQLVTCVIDLDPITHPGQPSPLNELRAAVSISDVFQFLVEMKMISFLQYNIVEHIIVGLCTESDELNEALQKYKDHFSRYIKVRVFETHPFQRGEVKVFDETNPSCSPPHLVIVTDKTWNKYIPFLNIFNLKKHVVQIFGIQEFYLDLESIDHVSAVPATDKDLQLDDFITDPKKRGIMLYALQRTVILYSIGYLRGVNNNTTRCAERPSTHKLRRLFCTCKVR